MIEWDLETDREIRAFGQHPGGRTRVEVSPDGRLLLISAANFEGGILSLWDLETGREIRRFSSDGACCVDIDMSLDGFAYSPKSLARGSGSFEARQNGWPVSLDGRWRKRVLAKIIEE